MYMFDLIGFGDVIYDENVLVGNGGFVIFCFNWFLL